MTRTEQDDGETLRPARRPAFSAIAEVGEKGAETHARLLKAGLEVLDADGYHGTRVEAITGRAGCSRPTFYQYFADKADFFLHLAVHADRSLGEIAASFPRIDRGRRSRDDVRDWLARLERLQSEYAPVFRFEALLRSDARIARGSEERLLAAGQVIAAGLDLPIETRPSLAIRGTLVFSTLTEAFAAPDRTIEQERLFEGAADWVHRCFVGPIRGVNAPETQKTAVSGRQNGGERSRPISRQAPPAGLSEIGPKAALSRLRLLEVAPEVFGRLGYEGTRVDDLTSAASMSHGSFYRYFAGKPAIFEEVARPAVEDLMVLLDQLPDPRGGLHGWSRRLYLTDGFHQGLFSAWAGSAAAREAIESADLDEVGFVAESLLAQRPFGDPAVDAFLFLAHVERAPCAARAYPSLSQPQAIAATGEILERGFFSEAS